jgi:hypothetical protein
MATTLNLPTPRPGRPGSRPPYRPVATPASEGATGRLEPPPPPSAAAPEPAAEAGQASAAVIRLGGPTAVPDRPLDDADLVVVHALGHALREQSRTLLGAVRALDPADALGVAEVRAWFEAFEGVVVGQQRVVDRVLLPALVDAAPGTARLVPEVRHGQGEVAEAVGRVGLALGHLADAVAPGTVAAATAGVGQAVAAAERLVAAVDRHLGGEGAALVAAVVEHLPRRAFMELRGEFLLVGDQAALAFAFPWATRFASPTEAERIVAQLPRRLRALHRAVWEPAYRRAFPRLVAAEARPVGPAAAVA